MMNCEIQKAYQDYIKLLTDELTEVVGIANRQGWKSSRCEEGERLRNLIKSHEDVYSTENIKASINPMLTGFVCQMNEYTKSQLIEMAVKYMKERGIDFGSTQVNDTAIEMYLAGAKLFQDTYVELLKAFKEEWIENARQFAHESVELKRENVELRVRLKSMENIKETI